MMQAVGTPDTSFYYRLGYAAAAAIYVGYMLVLWRRWRRLGGERTRQ
jgi:hypothetical protein